MYDIKFHGSMIYKFQIITHKNNFHDASNNVNLHNVSCIHGQLSSKKSMVKAITI